MPAKQKTSAPKVLISVQASEPRRLFALGVLVVLGVLVLWVAFSSPPALMWQVFLIGFGVVVLVLADRLRRATALRLDLTSEALLASDGTVLARVEDIASVDRGVFSFKPSNGFLLRLRTSAPRHWAPGLWWRTGRRIGVGGVTSASHTKQMAEILQAMLAERDAD